MRTTWSAAALALCGLLAAGCKPPAYSGYASPNGDFQCSVPWAWSVIYDAEGTYFTNLTFIGPFEPEFYLGAPSFSVRWYTRYTSHRLRDGQTEMYADADDFINQILDSVYGKDRRMEVPLHEVDIDGRRFKHFVVVSAGPAAPGARWGTAADQAGNTINPRQHAYAVLPMSRGFYVLTYPATRQAYKKYYEQFNALVKSFVPLKDGPGGPPLPPPSRSKAAK
ncbi:MAG: hypothetical protein PHU21_04870 [Elusimicrobia bacterium]|nr:hypothetical protein [Elusimicrobiota bacterium]